MKITKVESRIVEIPLTNPYIFSHGFLRAHANILVWVHTDEGVVGVGEASFIPPGGGVFEEAPESVKVIIDRYLGPLILGEDPFDVDRIHRKMDAVFPRNLVSKSGIDLALWDLMGRSLGLPVCKLLGGVGEPKILCTYTLSIDTPEKMAQQALRMTSQGYKALVVKIGRDPSHDVERLRQVREAVGDGVKLRLDANEAYRPDEAIRMVRRMEKYEPEFIEEPVSRWDVEGMARVAAAVDIPVSSDESNTSFETVVRLIRKRAVGVINIKLSKNGGLFRAKKIAALAESAGVPCILGGANTFEVARQAHRHFAVSTGQAQLGLGSEGCAPPSQFVVDDITTRFLGYQDVAAGEGYIETIPGAGLGVEIDQAKLAKYAVA